MDIQISDEAVEAAAAVCYAGQELTPNHAKQLLRAAAPYLIAAELEQLADGIREMLLERKGDTWAAGWDSAIRAVLGPLDGRARAAELRGESR